MKNISQEFFLLGLTIAILAIMIFISSTSPSKEEFIELHWSIFKISFIPKNQVTCVLRPCSISGDYKFGNLDLNGKTYGIILIDLENPRRYDNMCIDMNRNDVFCEQNEGPFIEGSSFLIESKSFNIISFEENNFAIANYPKIVNSSNFTVGFVIRSFYHRNMNFNLSMFVNETLEKSEVISLVPKQELTMNYSVSLKGEGLNKILIVANSSEGNQQSAIDFWVEYST